MIRILGMLSFCALGFMGCAGFKAEPPQGFASYANTDDFQAVSPEGVLFRVKSVPHKPHADLAFWKEALTMRMQAAGYVTLDTLTFPIDGVPAMGLLMEAPQGSQDQRYLVVAVPTPKQMVVIEAAGEVSQFQKHHASILQAIQKNTLK